MMVLRSAWPRGRKPYNRYFELLKLVNQILPRTPGQPRRSPAMTAKPAYFDRDADLSAVIISRRRMAFIRVW